MPVFALLAGCQITSQSPQQHQYDAAATLADVASDKKSSPSFDAIVTASWRYRQGQDDQGKKIRLHQLDDLSPEALREKHQQHLKFIAQLDALEPTDLSQEDQLNWQILRAQLAELADNYRFKQHLMPLTSEYGFHNAIANIRHQYQFNKISDYQNYLKQLAQIPNYFSQQTHWLQQGLKSGITQPQVALRGFEQTIKNYIKDDPKTSSFYLPFKNIAIELPKTQRLQLEKRALAIIENKVLASYRRYYDFMVQQYIPQARQTVGASALPNGNSFYANRVKYYTTLDMTPDQVHQLGLSEVARIRAEMEDIIQSLNFSGSFAQFLTFLRTDPRFYAKTPQQLLEKAAWLAKKADAILPKLFNKLPRTPYGVAPVPAAIAPKYTTGRYKGADNANEAGYYWVNTYALDKRPLYVLPALTLHEAVPGHHLQISLNKELTHLPDFRRQSYISAFGEGWGLYAEWLGVETNYYANEYEHFGRLSYEMWRACRLVVDTGLHAKGWTRQQVIDYMSENTALSLHNIQTETDRYISWPGQALSYKIGELTIKRLRKKTQQALGKHFSLKEFHQQVLSQGSIPLRMLEQQIDQYILQAKKK